MLSAARPYQVESINGIMVQRCDILSADPRTRLHIKAFEIALRRMPSPIRLESHKTIAWRAITRNFGQIVILGLLALATGCEGPQSALDPAGTAAEALAFLFWFMAGGAVVIWVFVLALGIYSLLRPQSGGRRKAAWYIIGGGVVGPTIVLTALLAHGLSLLPTLVAPPPDGSLQITVVGHQWWWRVQYPYEDKTIELANEIHLPVGQPVSFELESADVIHSFWIPSLGGKVDMIPGRKTRLTLHPTKTGVYRGVCAEYCGESHAHMAFKVVIEQPEEFQKWLEHQSQDAQPSGEPMPQRGEHVFLASGCGACHTVRGTSAKGRVGPDLTHVGGRLSLAAGTLRNEQGDFARWIKQPQSVKPAALMPHYSMLPEEDIEALATYLDNLQ